MAGEQSRQPLGGAGDRPVQRVSLPYRTHNVVRRPLDPSDAFPLTFAWLPVGICSPGLRTGSRRRCPRWEERHRRRVTAHLLGRRPRDGSRLRPAQVCSPCRARCPPQRRSPAGCGPACTAGAGFRERFAWMTSAVPPSSSSPHGTSARKGSESGSVRSSSTVPSAQAHLRQFHFRSSLMTVV